MSENIIFHSSWTGTLSEFDIFLKRYNCQIDEVLKDGVTFEGKAYKIKVHMLVADAPARAKACNTTNFNGKYGCIKCLHPTFSKGQGITVYPTLRKLNELELLRNTNLAPKHHRPLTKSIEMRTAKVYRQHLAQSILSSKPFQGIKGPTHLSQWMNIPDGIYLDKMHMCDIGTFKSIFNSFFDTHKKNEKFYLGNFIFKRFEVI